MNIVRRSVATTTLFATRLTSRGASKVFSFLCSGAFESFGRRSVLQVPVRLRGVSHIAIGEGVFVGSHSWLEAVHNPKNRPALTLGDGTSISGMAHITAALSIRLGENVLLARNVFISDHNHRFDDPETPINLQGLTDPQPVVIEDGAWIGENAVVLAGVTIGRGAVIGANAVVVEDIPARCIAVGAPARVVRMLGDGPWARGSAP